ncbi:MAG: hypothetical protein BRD28_04280 [Bacteroidetes bacterium QH_10_64_37]|nr:MAG: hypothetical protein BRD28_04280 [Bacteroidetes bacterium QH_10_64_37]
MLCLALLPACSDDPILGPTDGSSDDGGGSYSSINRLSPNVVDSSSSTPAAPSGRDPVNPERF